MNGFGFDAAIALADATPEDVVCERVYGGVRVTADWSEGRESATLVVSGEVDRRDAPAYVELFFHDVFLLLNLAAPGSFAGTISVTGGELRVRELTFDANVFASARGSRLPLSKVTEWYDRLEMGTRQLPANAVEAALFQLLHLGRGTEDEAVAIDRLARAAEGLGATDELPRALASGRAPLFHPMHDDALDPRVEEASQAWVELADAAARVVVGALQRAASA